MMPDTDGGLIQVTREVRRCERVIDARSLRCLAKRLTAIDHRTTTAPPPVGRLVRRSRPTEQSLDGALDLFARQADVRDDLVVFGNDARSSTNGAIFGTNARSCDALVLASAALAV